MEYIPAKTIVTHTKSSSWFGTDYNMNIYKGCCHGCIYCDSRSECYGIEDFDQVKAKGNPNMLGEDALTIIRNDLRRKVKTGVIGTGGMSDPYNPFEKDLQLTRHALELIDAFGFGVSIATKSPLVTRDIDILETIKEHSPTLVKMTITTAEEELCQKIERNAAPVSKRFQALKELSERGIYCGILLMPILPFINDTSENILTIVHLAKENGAKFIYPSFGVTLRTNQRHYYYEKLEEYFPGLKEKYVKQYGNSYQCFSRKAKTLYEVFFKECERYGILYNMKDIVRSYKRGYECQQLSFFPE